MYLALQSRLINPDFGGSGAQIATFRDNSKKKMFLSNPLVEG